MRGMLTAKNACAFHRRHSGHLSVVPRYDKGRTVAIPDRNEWAAVQPTGATRVLGWLPECKRVLSRSDSWAHSIQEMRGTNMIWFGAAEKRRRFRAKWNGICHSATRLVGVHRIISCLTSRAHGASISMVSANALDSQTRKSSLSYAYYSDYKLSVALPRTCVGHGVMASRI